MRSRGTLLLGLAMLAGCATGTPTAIRSPPPGDLTVNEAIAQPDAHTGRRVRWGGIIVGVENQADASTIEVIAKPLTAGGRPRDVDESPGRFLVQTRGFVDPAVYAQGRELTVAGTLRGTDTRLIGKHRYRYPVVDAAHFHLWPRRVEVRRDYDPYWDPFWPRPWYP